MWRQQAPEGRTGLTLEAALRLDPGLPGQNLERPPDREAPRVARRVVVDAELMRQSSGRSQYEVWGQRPIRIHAG